MMAVFHFSISLLLIGLFFVIFSIPVSAETFDYGFEIKEIDVCKQYYDIIIKADKTKYACVKETSIKKLVNRGWGFDQFSISFDKKQPSLEGRITLLTAEKSLNSKELLLYMEISENADDISEQRVRILDHMRKGIQNTGSFIAIKTSYIDKEIPHMPIISDDGTVVFLDDTACGRIITLSDRISFLEYVDSMYYFMDESVTYDIAVNSAKIYSPRIGTDMSKPDGKEKVYDAFCMHNLVSDEDPKTIQKCMANYIKSDDWITQLYTPSYIGMSAPSPVGFAYFDGFMPIPKYCENTYEEKLTVQGPARVSEDNLIVYMDEKDCNDIFETYNPINNVQDTFSFCTFFLPYGGNVEKAINVMNEYAAQVKNGTIETGSRHIHHPVTVNEFYAMNYAN